MNTLSDKSDSFFGEPAYWPACTQQARSGLGFSVEKRLTAKSSLILGDLGRVLPTTVPSDLSKFAFEVLPTALAVEPLTSQRIAKAAGPMPPLVQIADDFAACRHMASIPGNS